MRKLKLILLPLLLWSVGFSTADYGTVLSGRHLTTIAKLTGDDTNKSRKGRQIPLLAVTKSNPNAKYQEARFFIQGGLHGNEKLTSTFVIWLAQRFSRNTSLLNKIDAKKITIDFVPIANPDGAREANRYNNNRVNLNRNFPINWGISRENPGQKPFSEPETRAIDSLFTLRDYMGAIDVHGYINWLVLPSAHKNLTATHSLQKQATYESWSNSIGVLAKKHLPDYEVHSAMSLGDGGAFEDWAFWQKKVPAICLEMSHRSRNPSINNAKTDTFLKYEAFVFDALDEALKLRYSGNTSIAKKH